MLSFILLINCCTKIDTSFLISFFSIANNKTTLVSLLLFFTECKKLSSKINSLLFSQKLVYAPIFIIHLSFCIGITKGKCTFKKALNGPVCGGIIALGFNTENNIIERSKPSI